MLIKFKIVDRRGYPIFQIADEEPVIEPGDSVRLINHAKSVLRNLKWAFKSHEDATNAVRMRRPGAKGMEFAQFVGRIVSSASLLNPTKLDDFKNEVNALLDKLNPSDPTVKELKQLCKVKSPGEKFREINVTGC